MIVSISAVNENDGKFSGDILRLSFLGEMTVEFNRPEEKSACGTFLPNPAAWPEV